MTKEFNLFEQEQQDNKAASTAVVHPAGTLCPEKFVDALDKLRNQQTQQSHQEQNLMKRIIEALLFASNEPIPFNKLREILETSFPIKPRSLKKIITELQEDYVSQNRAFRLEEIAQGYVLRSCEEYSRYIDLLYRNRRTEKLSQPATEVLAIIAYRQPITRPQIDAIRGVDSSGTMVSLVERGLIEAVGRAESPGRPTIYAVTQEFLKYFGLKDLKELPMLKTTSRESFCQ